MAGSNTISGGGLGTITFTEYGSQQSQAYVSTLVGAIQAIITNGGSVTNVNEGSGSGSAYFPTQAEPIYDLVPTTVQGTTSQDFTIATAGYVIDTVAGSVSITGAAAGGDTILVLGNNTSTTVSTFGTGNSVIFVDGNNLYDGSQSGGGDFVDGGSGNDTMNTGTGDTTIRSGTGYDSITLNDTGSDTSYNDVVYLDVGHANVIADGTGDYVVATASGQTISGGAAQTAASNLTVVLVGTGTGDLVTGGAGYLTVADNAGGNTISGGAGGLTFLGGANVSDVINLGGSTALIFGNSGDNLTLGQVPGDFAGAIFTAGGGNETLNGGSAIGNLEIFGAAQSVSGASDLLIGGAGNDTLVAGSGSETLDGGAGSNTFLIDAYGSENANITIGDFLSGNDSVAFGHYSEADVQAALAGGQDVNGNFVITFDTSNTTITLTGVTSASQLDGHIITFT